MRGILIGPDDTVAGMILCKYVCKVLLDGLATVNGIGLRRQENRVFRVERGYGSGIILIKRILIRFIFGIKQLLAQLRIGCFHCFLELLHYSIGAESCFQIGQAINAKIGRFVPTITRRRRRTIEQLLTQLQASEHDKFVAHLYRARKQYRLVCERPNKGNKAIERELLSRYQIAQSLGFNGDFRAWEHLLRIHE
jgi:hypothetical protein